MKSSTKNLVLQDRIATDLYTDPEIFEKEMDRIFSTTWVWVAHTSEIANAGDFKLSKVGREPVIVVRDRKGAVNVHVNRCRHRAATVCEVKRGKASSFVCPYHGWSYGLDGALRAVPHENGYGGDLDKSNLGLKSLKVAEYNGLIFASFNQDVEPLEEYLGAAKIWIDLFMKQSGPFGVTTLGDFHFKFNGNWKIQLENTTDAYHFPIVHKTFLAASDEETNTQFDFLSNGGYLKDLGNGHSVAVMMPDLVDLDEHSDAPIPQRYEKLAQELSEEFSPDMVRKIVKAVGGVGFNLNLFPNLACSMAFFRVLEPISVNETSIRHIALGMDGGPTIANQARMRMHEFFQGPMGFGTPDDAEVWERVQAGTAGGKELSIMLNRGLAIETRDESGLITGDVSSEIGMRGAYRQWFKMMAEQ